MVFRRAIIMTLFLFGLCGVGSCQWTQTSYAFNIETDNVRNAIEEFTIPEDDQYEWEFDVPNWYLVTGDSTQEPRWALPFANLCTNQWSFHQFSTDYLYEGDTVWTYEVYETRWGHQTFQRESPPEAARRDIGDQQSPGHHVTTYCYYIVD